jgi:hypothetical protein
LHAFNTSCLGDIPDFFDAGVHENSDRANFRRYRVDNSPDDPRLNVAWTLRVKIKPNHVSAEFGARFGVFNIRDTTNLDLHWSHR